jgi:hypothetical protein
MVLQTSGTICLDDLAAEFGGTAPHCLNEYYRGGGLVPDTGTNAGIPASGQICLDDFYGGDVVSGPPSGYIYGWGQNKFGMFSRDGTTSDATGVKWSQSGSNYITGSAGNFAFGAWVDTNGDIYCENPGEQATSGVTGALLQRVPGASVDTSSYDTLHAFGQQNVSPGTSPGNYSVGVQWIKTDGRLWSSVDNLYANRGDGTVGGGGVDRTESSYETSQGGTDWKTVDASGTQYSIATKTDGRLWGWGRHDTSQLQDRFGRNKAAGDATVTTPIQLGQSTTDWDVYMEMTVNKTDGRLWGFGEFAYHMNNFGGSGQGNKNPNQVFGSYTNWTDRHGYGWGIKTDGRLWSFVYNGAGEFGDGTAAGTSAPTISPRETSQGGTNWTGYSKSIYNEKAHVKTDGRLWSWGSNTQSLQTFMNGTGASTASLLTPVQASIGGTTWIWTSGYGPGPFNHGMTAISTT